MKRLNIKRLAGLWVAILLVLLTTNAFALGVVSLKPGYFADPTRGRPISSANIYVGIVDLDPKVPANRKQAFIQQENGTIVQIDQPIRTSAGGVPTYLGATVTLLVDGDYSVRVDDKNGDQIYYIPKQTYTATSSEVGLNYCYPNYTEEDQGATGTTVTVKSCVDSIAAKDGTIFMRHSSGNTSTEYIFLTPETMPANIKISFEKGAMFSTAALSIPINGPLEAGLYQIFDGTGVVFGEGAVEGTRPEWWAENVTPGTTDMSDAVQAATNASTGTVFLSSTYAMEDVDVPTTKDYLFTGGGTIVVTGATGFHREAASSPRVEDRATWDNLNFINSVADSVTIYEDLFFSSSAHTGIHVNNNKFTLSNEAIGVGLSGSQGGVISKNRFYNDNTSIAMQVINTAVSHETIAISYRIVDNWVRLGIGFETTPISTHAQEGFIFTNNIFFSSTFTCASGNNLKLIGNTFINSYVLVGGFNGQINNNYFDKPPAVSRHLLQISTEYVTSRGWVVTGNSFLGLDVEGTDVSFFRIGSDVTADGAQLLDVVVSNNNYVGGSLLRNTGVEVDSSVIPKWLYFGGDSFDTLHTAIKFTTAISRSRIELFNVTDIDYYVEGVPANTADFVQTDVVYKEFDITMSAPTYVVSGTSDDIITQTFTYPTMMSVAPIIINTPVSGSNNFSVGTGDSFQGYFIASLIKQAAAATPGLVTATSSIVLDGRRSPNGN